MRNLKHAMILTLNGCLRQSCNSFVPETDFPKVAKWVRRRKTTSRLRNLHSLLSPKQRQEQRRVGQLRCEVSHYLLKQLPTPYPRRTIQDLCPYKKIPSKNFRTLSIIHITPHHVLVAGALLRPSIVMLTLFKLEEIGFVITTANYALDLRLYVSLNTAI
jgi:hypothetical protein